MREGLGIRRGRYSRLTRGGMFLIQTAPSRIRGAGNPVRTGRRSPHGQNRTLRFYLIHHLTTLPQPRPLRHSRLSSTARSPIPKPPISFPLRFAQAHQVPISLPSVVAQPMSEDTRNHLYSARIRPRSLDPHRGIGRIGRCRPRVRSIMRIVRVLEGGSP